MKDLKYCRTNCQIEVHACYQKKQHYTYQKITAAAGILPLHTLRPAKLAPTFFKPGLLIPRCNSTEWSSQRSLGWKVLNALDIRPRPFWWNSPFPFPLGAVCCQWWWQQNEFSLALPRHRLMVQTGVHLLFQSISGASQYILLRVRNCNGPYCSYCLY